LLSTLTWNRFHQSRRWPCWRRSWQRSPSFSNRAIENCRLCSKVQNEVRKAQRMSVNKHVSSHELLFLWLTCCMTSIGCWFCWSLRWG
jgi:hypothetical protein